MELTTMFATGAAVLTTGSFIPQALKTLKTRETKDISLWMYVFFSIGLILWEVYGIIIMEWPIILANGVTFMLVLPILVLKILNKEK
jgi:MtN3 and saliva related transmembrane protein